MNYTILIVDDDMAINDMLVKYLRKNGYITYSAYSGTEALTIIKNDNIDLILLDLMLPGIDGEDIIKKINKTIPIIVISAKTSPIDKAKVLLDGANDYITKPFEKIELLARIKVQLRISNNQNKNLKYGDIELLKDNKTMEINKNKISLTRTEYTIMRELILAPNKVVTKTRLLDLISINAENCDENSLKVHISNIRKKIRKNTQEEYIEAIWGIGYKIKK